MRFQPTPSLRRATKYAEWLTEQGLISTHALLAEGDREVTATSLVFYEFQPTPSLRRATIPRATWLSPATHFNPRPPCGGRPPTSRPSTMHINFNPRPPCGGRPGQACPERLAIRISTHALLAEGDMRVYRPANPADAFQPTPSLRRATRFLRGRG